MTLFMLLNPLMPLTSHILLSNFKLKNLSNTSHYHSHTKFSTSHNQLSSGNLHNLVSDQPSLVHSLHILFLLFIRLHFVIKNQRSLVLICITQSWNHLPVSLVNLIQKSCSSWTHFAYRGRSDYHFLPHRSGIISL